ncbi:MAG TPA: hypothetical protein PKD56_04120 [Chitinophagales bacterium]|nr:hypothetical protein [Chitinophagales bacterium]
MAEENKVLKPLFIALIVLLLIINAFLFYNNRQMKAQHEQAVATLADEKAGLQSEVDKALADIEQLRLDNSQLDSSLGTARSEIEAKAAEIKKLLSKGNASRSELAKARQMIESLRGEVETFKRQIAELQYANQQLTTEKTTLTEQNVSLKTNLDSQLTQNQQLQQKNTDLTSKTENLTQAKESLTKTVNRGKVLSAGNISGSGVKVKRSGKEVATSRNQRAEKMKVCFDVLENAIADPGQKTIYLRIVTPKGEVMSIESMGSGTIKLSDTGETVQYTAKAAINYQRSVENYCMYWQPDNDFDEGTYEVELYQDGYRIGSSKYVMK